MPGCLLVSVRKQGASRGPIQSCKKALVGDFFRAAPSHRASASTWAPTSGPRSSQRQAAVVAGVSPSTRTTVLSPQASQIASSAVHSALVCSMTCGRIRYSGPPVPDRQRLVTCSCSTFLHTTLAAPPGAGRHGVYGSSPADKARRPPRHETGSATPRAQIRSRGTSTADTNRPTASSAEEPRKRSISSPPIDLRT